MTDSIKPPYKTDWSFVGALALPFALIALAVVAIVVSR